MVTAVLHKYVKRRKVSSALDCDVTEPVLDLKYLFFFRPKDGRMTVTKTSGGSTCKKVFPQILVCQVFRWPQIVFHNDIKSSETCQHPGAVKPPNLLISQAGKMFFLYINDHMLKSYLQLFNLLNS